MTRNAKITWGVGALVWAVTYCLLALQVPYNNTSVLVQWGLIALAGLVGFFSMFLTYCLFFSPSEKIKRGIKSAKMKHPTKYNGTYFDSNIAVVVGIPRLALASE